MVRRCHTKQYDAKEKYRGIFEIQKSGDKTSPGEIGLDIRTHASPKVLFITIYQRLKLNEFDGAGVNYFHYVNYSVHHDHFSLFCYILVTIVPFVAWRLVADPLEGIDVLLCNTSRCVVAVTLSIYCRSVSTIHSFYMHSMCRRHSLWMWLALQETPTLPWHLFSPLVSRGHCQTLCQNDQAATNSRLTNFSKRVTAKRSITLVPFERVTFVEYACQI